MRVRQAYSLRATGGPGTYKNGGPPVARRMVSVAISS